MFDSLQATVADIHSKAAELRNTFGDDARARTLEWAAMRIEQAILTIEQTPYTLTEAAAQSGYSVDHLSRLLRETKLPNAGRKGAPRIKAVDLPTKSSRVAHGRRKPYNPITDARALRESG